MKKDKIKGMIYGGIVGDALGVPVEYKERDTFLITDMIGFGTYHVPQGMWSVDSSFSLMLIENISEQKNLDYLMNKFLNYIRKGYMTPDNYMFNVGKTTLNAIYRYEEGTRALNCGGTTVRDNTNGALARISPLLPELFYENTIEDRFQLVKNVTKITHNHPKSILGSLIFMEILYHLYMELSLEESMEITFQEVTNFCKNHFIYKIEWENYKYIFDNLKEKQREEINSEGDVISSLEASLWCVLTTSSFDEAVLLGVNLGNDSNTIASLTGNIAGLIYGYKEINKIWLSKLKNKKLIDQVTKPYFNRFSNV